MIRFQFYRFKSDKLLAIAPAKKIKVMEGNKVKFHRRKRRWRRKPKSLLPIPPNDNRSNLNRPFAPNPFVFSQFPVNNFTQPLFPPTNFQQQIWNFQGTTPEPRFLIDGQISDQTIQTHLPNRDSYFTFHNPNLSNNCFGNKEELKVSELTFIEQESTNITHCLNTSCNRVEYNKQEKPFQYNRFSNSNTDYITIYNSSKEENLHEVDSIKTNTKLKQNMNLGDLENDNVQYLYTVDRSSAGCIVEEIDLSHENKPTDCKSNLMESELVTTIKSRKRKNENGNDDPRKRNNANCMQPLCSLCNRDFEILSKTNDYLYTGECSHMFCSICMYSLKCRNNCEICGNKITQLRKVYV